MLVVIAIWKYYFEKSIKSYYSKKNSQYITFFFSFAFVQYVGS
jgi:hypothetical protein